MDMIIPPRRQHPVAMLRYTFRYLFLLLVPLARGLRYINTPQGLYQWVRGTWIDLTAILLLLLLPLIAWWRRTYALTDGGFILRRGVILRHETHIPRRHITTLSVERPFYLRPLRAVRVAIDTDAGDRYRADFSLTVGEKPAQEILSQRQSHMLQTWHRFRPRWYHVAVLSLLASNSLSGILLLASALHQAGQLFGEGYRQDLLGELETVAGYVTVIPRTAALIALILLGGWGIAAIRNLLRYLPFCVTRSAATLTVRTGLLTRRDHLCTVPSVNYVDYRQSIVSKLLRLHMVFIHCIGYGKGRDALAVLIPASSVRASEHQVRRLLPEFRRQAVTVRPARYSILRYILLPLWGVILLYPVSRILSDILVRWQELIDHLVFMAYIPLLWMMAVKIIDRYTGGFTRQNGFYTLYYSRLLTFHTVVVPERKVVTIRLRQTPFQHFTNTCDVLIYTYNEAHQHHRIKNIRQADACALLETSSDKQQGEV